jgi:hypothetical protein
MMKLVIKWALKTLIGRWVTGLLVTSLLSGAAYWWYDFKDDLVAEGEEICVQEINKETMLQLQAALAEEKSARAVLTARLIAVAAVNQEANDRRLALQNQLSDLEKAMAEQARTDGEYKAWSDTPLPDGVGSRLRNQAASDNSSAFRDSQD